MITFSIIIPAYNVAGFITKTLQAVIDQTFEDYELIVVNDGSSDETAGVVESFLQAKLDKSKFQVITQKNGGVSAARNTGLDLAKGNYLYFLDSDDLIDEDFLQRAYDHFLEYPEAELYCCNYRLLYENGEKEQRLNQFQHLGLINSADMLESELSGNTYTCTIALVWKRSVFEENSLTYVEGCSYGEDSEVLFKYLCHIDKVINNPKCLVSYLQHPASAMANDFSIKRLSYFERLDRLEQYFKSTNKLTGSVNSCLLVNRARTYVRNFNDCYLSIIKRRSEKSSLKEFTYSPLIQQNRLKVKNNFFRISSNSLKVKLLLLFYFRPLYCLILKIKHSI